MICHQSWVSLIILAGAPIALELSGTSLEIIDPAPVLDLVPILTGAINIVSLPIKAPSLIVVRFLLTPS